MVREGGNEVQRVAVEPGFEGTGRRETNFDGHYANAIAGAVVHAIRNHLPPEAANNPDSPNLQPTHSPGVTAFDFASGIRNPPKRPRFSPPSLFDNVRKRKRGKKAQAVKVISYVRDVILLPMEFKKRDGEICIPRCGKRSLLGKAGLVGKLELSSDMSDEDVRREICEVFATPMGLSEPDLKINNFFRFTYLQRAGAGSRSLCLPSVKDNFEWNGRQVASLAKAGSFIYLMAEEELPGYNLMVSFVTFCSSYAYWCVFVLIDEEGISSGHIQW